MTTYAYRRYTIRETYPVHVEDITLTSEQVYEHTSRVGDYAFQTLLDRWNRQAFAQFEMGNPLFVYIRVLDQ